MKRNPIIGRYLFILDTNILLFALNALMVFYDQELMIPITVIEEIDRCQKDRNETGRNARFVLRKPNNLHKQGNFS